MELYQLQYFQTVCQMRSYTKASERLMVSQPAVSIAIKKLEDELGGKLIDRTQKTFTLTPMGEVFYERVISVNAMISYIYKEMGMFSNQYIETVRVAFPDVILPELLKEITMKFTAQFPEIPLRISKMSQTSIIKKLDDREIDLGIICADAAKLNPTFNTVKFREVELFATFSPDSRFSGMEMIPREMLAEEQLLVAKRGVLSNTVINYFREGGIEPRCLNCLDDDLHTSDAYKLSSEGAGIAFLDKEFQRKGNFAPLDPPLRTEMVIAWSPNVASETTMEMIKKVIIHLQSL